MIGTIALPLEEKYDGHETFVWVMVANYEWYV